MNNQYQGILPCLDAFKSVTLSSSLATSSGSEELDTLDTSALVKACQILSSEIKLEVLLNKLLQITVNYAGTRFFNKERISIGLKELKKESFYVQLETDFELKPSSCVMKKFKLTVQKNWNVLYLCPSSIL